MGADLTCASIIAAGIALILALAYWYITRIFTFFNKLGIPGPLPSFPFGTWNRSARQFLGAEDIANSTKYGPIFGTFDGLKPNLLIAEPKLVKEILVSDSLKDRRVNQASDGAIKRVLQVLCGEDQKNINTLLTSTVKNQRISKLFTRMETTVNSLVRGLVNNKEDTKVTINDIVADFVHDTSALALLGIDLNEDPVFRQGYLKRSLTLYSAKNTTSSLAVLPHLYGGEDSWIIPKSTLEYFKAIIISTINKRAAEENVESKAADFVDILLEAAKQEKALIAKEKAQDKIEEVGATDDDVVLNKEALTDQVLAAILILNHWTKSVVIFGVHALAKEDGVQEKLHQEVKTMESASFDVIQSLPYLDMVVSEVLRLHTPEFRLEKVAIKELQLKENVTLPKGTFISVPLFAVHQSKELHEDPTKFKPERFTSEKVTKQTPPILLPFGQAGEDGSCIGLQLGIYAAKLALFKIANKLKLKAVENADVNIYKTGVTGVPLPADITVHAERRV